jgi:hypothetical protein
MKQSNAIPTQSNGQHRAAQTPNALKRAIYFKDVQASYGRVAVCIWSRSLSSICFSSACHISLIRIWSASSPMKSSWDELAMLHNSQCVVLRLEPRRPQWPQRPQKCATWRTDVKIQDMLWHVTCVTTVTCVTCIRSNTYAHWMTLHAAKEQVQAALPIALLPQGPPAPRTVKTPHCKAPEIRRQTDSTLVLFSQHCEEQACSRKRSVVTWYKYAIWFVCSNANMTQTYWNCKLNHGFQRTSKGSVSPNNLDLKTRI